MKSNYEVLIEKLDEFIRKFYMNKLWRGLLLELLIFLCFFLILNVVEYFGHFSVAVRTVLFYSFVLLNIGVISYYVIVPLASLYRLGGRISHEQAAKIIGSHFSSIRDKLINTLQLKSLTSGNAQMSGSLIEASINQRIEDLRPVPFASVIDFTENRKYLKGVLIFLAILLAVLFWAPSLIKEGSMRLISHNTYFAKPAPFQLNVLNRKLEVIQNDDLFLDMRVTGKEVPAEVFIELEDNLFKAESSGDSRFRYEFKNLQSDVSFRLFADGFYSEPYNVKVLPRPTIVSFEMSMEYPAYLNRKSETIINNGDLVIPSGTSVTWKFQTRNINALHLGFKEGLTSLEAEGEEFIFRKRIFSSEKYHVFGSNEHVKNRDSLEYSITVIPDMYPSLEVQESPDSLNRQMVYFNGNAKDDYGFSRLAFKYRIKGGGDEKSISIPINKSDVQYSFFHVLDLASLSLGEEQELECFFEVWDNDGIAKGKSARSHVFTYKKLSKDELLKQRDMESESIKDAMRETVKEAKALQKEVSDLQKKLLENKQLSWEQKKKAEELVKREKQLENKVEQIQRQNEMHNNLSESMAMNEEVREKQEQIQEMLEQIIPEEMKEMFRELERMLENIDKQKLQEKLDQLKLGNKNIEKELDRSLEFLKRMEIEQKLEEGINKLKELAQEEQKLSEKAQEKNADSKALQEEQEKQQEKFNQLEKDLKGLEEKDQKLEDPFGFKNPEQEEKEINEQMDKAREESGNSKSKKASQHMKNAAEKMQQMSEKLSKMKDEMSSEEQGEDYNALRGLLKSLLKLSFSQEQLMKDLRVTDINNPKYLKISQEQKKIKDNAKIIEDSLFSLSKRVVQIKAVVNREIAAINQNIEKSLNYLELRDVNQAAGRQQYAMTSINNLALLLNESLQQMQQQMAQQGNQSCSKPGGKKPKSGFSSLKQKQEQLGKELKKSSGQKPGEGKPTSGELARMAAQQRAIRNELQKLLQQQTDKGQGSKSEMNSLINQMEQNEKDMVNKRLSPETQRRHQDIMTRLLEAEKAEREREQDEERQAREGKNFQYRNPSAFEEYKRLKQKEAELLKSVPPALNSFYKQKTKEYFQKLGAND